MVAGTPLKMDSHISISHNGNTLNLAADFIEHTSP